MKEIIKQFLDGIKDLLSTLTMEERVQFFHEVSSGYCRYCGIELRPGQYCNCENDE